jgi:hypothetical protein
MQRTKRSKKISAHACTKKNKELHTRSEVYFQGIKKQRHRDSRQMETQTDRQRRIKEPAMHKNHRNTIGKLGLLKKQRRDRDRDREKDSRVCNA